MAALTIQTCDPAGAELTMASAGGSGDTIAVRNKTTGLLVVNGNGSTCDVTVARPGTEYGQNVPDVVLSVSTGEQGILMIPPSFRDPSDSLVDVTYSVTSSVEVAAFELVDSGS